ncbi:MAG: hypothetical protein IJ072_05020, partial [Oscillospiraceae bacterium]|nr:hypothetical protein [Oscillospiraceae bacterium]
RDNCNLNMDRDGACDSEVLSEILSSDQHYPCIDVAGVHMEHAEIKTHPEVFGRLLYNESIEIYLILCYSDHIKELVPNRQSNSVNRPNRYVKLNNSSL